MDGELITLAASKDLGGDSARARLQAALDADAARERARAVRQALVGWLAVLGLPLWMAAAWPGAMSAGARAASATAWGGTLGAVVLARGWEWISRRRRSRLVARLGPPLVARRRPRENTGSD